MALNRLSCADVPLRNCSLHFVARGVRACTTWFVCLCAGQVLHAHVGTSTSITRR